MTEGRASLLAMTEGRRASLLAITGGGAYGLL
jgi:hypothetical protein